MVNTIVTFLAVVHILASMVSYKKTMKQFLKTIKVEKDNKNKSKNIPKEDGVILIQKTSKIHIGSLITKIQNGLSVSNLSRQESQPNEESSSRGFQRQMSVDSSQSSKMSEKVSNDKKDKIKKVERNSSIKKRHAPIPPEQQQQQEQQKQRG